MLLLLLENITWVPLLQAGQRRTVLLCINDETPIIPVCSNASFGFVWSFLHVAFQSSPGPSSGVTGAQNTTPGYGMRARIRTLAPGLAQQVLHC
ncbi:hypothetical protein STEG23_037304 [Scotinomys teguina]